MIELEAVSRTYQVSNEPPVHALRDVSLRITAGEMVAILGPSGSGKSTLMNVMGLLDRPDSGRYRLDGRSVSGLDDDELARLRSRFVGFVFQAYHLLPRTTALENVAMPLLYSRRSDHRARAAAALAAVGLADRCRHRAEELSGGQQQRVAIARALVNEPAILLADEPTGNLDSVASAGIMELFGEMNARGTTVILVTHDREVANAAKRTVRLHDGAIASDTLREATP